MHVISVKEIIEICTGKLIIGNINTKCISFCTDTRKIKMGDTYIGLKGEKFN